VQYTELGLPLVNCINETPFRIMVQKTEPREITEIINVVFMKFWTL
jgi:hypothetical protein